MALFDDMFGAAETQLDKEDTSSPGLPSYLIAANNHQVSGNQFSLFDPSTYGDAVLDTGKFAISAVTRAISSVYNIAPTIGNWLGGDFEEASTYDWLSQMDSSLGSYYQDHEGTINVVGDIVGSFVPGMAGVKVLNLGQKALATMAAGKQGFNLASHIGLLPSRAAAIGFDEGKRIAATSQSFRALNANVMKSLVAGYEQQVLEQAAFLTAAQVAMQKSPLFEHEDASDIFWNSLGGGLAGGAIMGTIAGVQTFGAVKKGMQAADRVINKAVTYSATEPAALATDRIALALHDIHNPPVAPANETPEVIKAFENKLITRQDNLWNSVRSEVHRITGDAELGNVFTDSLKSLDYDTAVGNVQYLADIGRLGKEGKSTAIESLYNKVLKGKSDKELPNLAVNYLKVSGEDAGKLILERPPIVNIADTVKNAAAVAKTVDGYKFKVGVDWAPAAAKDHFETEARYIWAQGKEITEELKIGPRDIPLLEKALSTEGISKITLLDGREIQKVDLLDYVKQVKGEQAVVMRDLLPNVTTEEIAKRVNVKRAYLEGEQNTADVTSDLFAFQSKPAKHWEKPSWVKLAYDVQPLNDQNGFVLDAIAHAKANQKELRESADRAFQMFNADVNSRLPKKIGDKAIAHATRTGAGGSLLTGQNENYGSLGSIAQQIGSVVNKWKQDLHRIVDDTFNGHNYAVLNSQAAKDDIVKVYNAVLGSPEKYVLEVDGAGESYLVMRKVRDYEAAINAGEDVSAPALLDKNSPQRIKLKSAEARDWIAQAVAHNDTHLSSVASRNAIQLGTSQQASLKGSVYFAPPNPKNFPHFAFVTDSTVTGTGAVRMIHAASESELEQLIARVDQTKGLKVVTKQASEEFHRAKQDYEYALGINENYINSAMARQGVSAPYFATTDAQKIIEEFMDWRKRTDVANAREWIKLKYAPEVETLNQLAKSYDAVALSKKAYTGKFGSDVVKNPYSNIVKTMLDVSTKDEYPIWTPLNRLAEKSVSALVSRIQDTYANASSEAEVNRVHAMLEESGIKANFTDAATMALANHRAPKPVLEEFIRKANSALSFLMLRADPLNAVNNGLGHTVLYGTETRDLVKNILKGNTEAAGELAELAHVKIPGKDLGSILSPQKLAADAYKAYAKLLGRNEEMQGLETFFREHGWMPSMIDQERSVIDAITLKGVEDSSELTKRATQVFNGAKTLAKPVTSLNQGVEDMNRFVSAYTAKSISDIAVKHGIIDADQQLAYINTFVNRTQGNYIASQRPMLFQGPVGQAVGLFQTYQFNLMQQLFRYVAEPGNKSAAYLLGLQGTVYGMNGLPAFNAINQHLVGNAAGNVNNKDIISQTYDTVGKEAGDWLMYGLSSNLFLHPDLKVNLYSRGDINPRQVTVVPTNFADVPVVGGVTKFFTSLKQTAEKIGAGGDVYSSILQGVEHAGISRPLAGLAQTMQAFNNPQLQAYSTTSKGGIIGSNDLLSLTTFARLAGGRPLDEAIANDATYRIKAYATSRSDEINTLGEALKTKIQTGSFGPEDVTEFAKSYAERGGKQEQFSKFMARQMLTAKVATANKLAEDLKNPGSQYMQAIMGGYRLQDLVNQ